MHDIINHKNNRLIQALRHEPVDRTPVWIMRQAGRYLPEYRELRKKVPDFMTFCKTPELACEATLQPLRRFPLDAAIVFSDILTVPEAMGMKLEFLNNEGPVIHNPIQSMDDVKRLIMPDMSRDLGYVMEAVRLCVKSLNGELPLIGFAGSPWTLATYMVEGGSSKTFKNIKTMLFQNPAVLHALLDRLTDTTVLYLNGQIDAGARAIMVFDTWGGVLSHNDYQEFSLQYLRKIAQKIQREIMSSNTKEKVPLIFFTKNGGLWLELLADSGCDALGLDWMIDIGEAKKRVGDRVALQGNLDPFLLFSNPTKIQKAVREILDKFGMTSGHVFNLGHGIDKDTPIENVTAMIDAVHRFGLHE